MSEIETIAVNPREAGTTGAVRALRRTGQVPGIVYGRDCEPVLINVDRRVIIKELNRGGFMHRIFDLKVGAASERCLPRDVQLHPVTDEPLHVDFLRLAIDSQIEVMVPVQFTNEELSPGIKRGGVLNVVRHEIELICPSDAIPDFLEIDLTGTDIGDALKFSRITLPGNVRPSITDRDFTIATIASTAAATDADEEGEAEEG